MVSLLLVCFVLQLVIHLINTIGKESVAGIAWLLYSKLPTQAASDARRSSSLRTEVIRLRTEMNSTSAQDEFSKWAKIRRQHDKALAEHEALSKELAAFKSSFDSRVGMARWAATNGLRFFVQTWFQRSPMFWLPRAAVPWYVEWVLSFPRAPLGSVSIQVWLGACAAAITLVSSALAAAWALMLRRSSGGFTEKQPVKMKAQAETTTSDEKEKKEL